jgi:outer membrane immunogenic protein
MFSAANIPLSRPREPGRGREFRAIEANPLNMGVGNLASPGATRLLVWEPARPRWAGCVFEIAGIAGIAGIFVPPHVSVTRGISDPVLGVLRQIHKFQCAPNAWEIWMNTRRPGIHRASARAVVSAALGSVFLSAANPNCAAAQDSRDSGKAVGADWAGVYGGLSAGFARGFSSQFDVAANTGTHAYSTTGGFAGAGLGFNYQFGNWVIGLDSDVSGGSITGSKGPNFNSDVSAFFLVRARFGYSVGNFLPFISVGPSYAWLNTSGLLPSAGLIAGRATRSGWSFSAGADYMLSPSWFLRAEYLYICYGTEFLRNVDSIELMGHYARLGVYHKFDVPGLKRESAGPDEAATSDEYDWRGIYFGPAIGGSAVAQQTQFSINNVSSPTMFANSTGGVRGFGLQGTLGFQAGMNWRLDRFIVGVEADFHVSQLAGAGVDSVVNTTIAGVPTMIKESDHIDELGTVRARFGLPINRWLIYGTAGVAYGGVSSDSRSSALGAIASAEFDSTRLGVVAGLGVERAIWGNWTTRLEYMYSNFGKLRYVVNGITPVPVGSNISVAQHILRVGFNFMIH